MTATPKPVSQILKELRHMGSEKGRRGMARFGINVEKAYGISVTKLRAYAKKIPKNHALAVELWKSASHEARILSLLVDEHAKVTEKQMDEMVRGFNSWDMTDLACNNLFYDTPYAYEKAFEWVKREREFEKRSGYAMMATLAWKGKKHSDAEFRKFFPAIVNGATDERNFVRKAVSWALRQMGKVNRELNSDAISVAEKIAAIDSKSARWIAADALRELKAVRKSGNYKRE